MMAATKPTTLHRDRRLTPTTSPLHPSMEPRPGRSNLHGHFSGGTSITSPAMAKKAIASYAKPKVASPSEPSSRTSAATFNTSSSSSKSSSARKLVDKPPSYSGQRSQLSIAITQRSLKPGFTTSRSSNSSKSDGVKAASRITRGARTTPVIKSKSSSSAPIKKKENAESTVAGSPPGEHPLDHRVVMDEMVAETSAELNNFVECSEVKSRGDEEENHMEKHGGEPEQCSEGFELQTVNEDTKQQVMATAVVDKGYELELEPAKALTVVNQVVQEAGKPWLGTKVSPMVDVAHAKKGVPRSNDVIEETKSKLMGMRKNRVLALVGAFETVISLQEPEAQQSQKALLVHHDQQIQKARPIGHILAYRDEVYRDEQSEEDQQHREIDEQDGNAGRRRV